MLYHDEIEDIDDDRGIILRQIRKNVRNKKNIIWDNQKNCGSLIKNILGYKSIINVLVFGKTQTGKTGCMTSLIREYVRDNNIPIDNIYIITGLSDVAWKKDTKNRMPDSINSRVFHRSNLPKSFIKDIKSKNLLVIMDEIQIACEEDQTIHKTFEKKWFTI